MAWIIRCIVTLVTFVWFNDIASCFLQGYHICILQTNVIIVKILLHCHCVLCCAQILVWNWAKFIINFCFPIITNVQFSMAYFHFFIIVRQISWWEQINVANFLQKLSYWKNAIHLLTRDIFPYGNPLFIRGSGNRTTLSLLSFDESDDQCYDSDQGDWHWALGSAQWAPYEGTMLFCTWDWTSLIFRSHSQAGSPSWHVAQGGHLVLFVKLKTFKFGKKTALSLSGLSCLHQRMQIGPKKGFKMQR